jgi:hypothetical protein
VREANTTGKRPDGSRQITPGGFSQIAQGMNETKLPENQKKNAKKT